MPLTTFSKNFTGSTKDSRSVTQAEAEDYQPRLIRSTTCQTINRCLVSSLDWLDRIDSLFARSDLKRENNQVLYVLFDSEEAMMMNERTKPTAING
ncbi:hypothetical protein H9L39_01457 [Fusarium oxysporum f. sp. albedinis]|nr:hypothetical protein H9L39_01457 [Fusarium oxysporum f. sp. albedinis]